ncbi:Histone-fold [Fusarium oxysporum f. sp. vasinfectum]|nr:Histone-fold [Fusarium oxysporum f. sp. vasinfectum]
MEAPDINAVGIFDKLSQPCDGVGKPVWNGTSLSNAAYNLILLLRASRIPEIPAFVFFRPLVQRRRWTESGEIHAAGCKPSSFARLCLRISELPIPRSKEPEDGLTCPKDIFAWFCCSSFDINSDQDSTYLGDEFRKLLSAGAFVVHVKDGLVYLSLSEPLRDTLFQVPTKALQEARLGLVGLVILSLAEPYAEPLWEMVSLHCRNILKSTVIPYLLQAETRELRQLSHMIEPTRNSRFNSALMTLPFHLVNLGFVIDLINWQDLFNHSSSSCNIIPEALGVLFDESDAVSKLDEILARTPWLQTSSFLWSLIGFAIAQKRRQSTDLDIPWWYEKTSNKWLVLGPSGSSTMGRVSRSLVFPETVQSEALPDQVQLSTQASLGIALNALGFPEHGCPLLDRFLTTTASGESSAFRPTESVPYGLLSADLLNYRNSAHKGKDLRLWGLGLVSSRDNAQLGNRFDSISIKLAVADIHISLADYATAENLLKQVSLSGNLDAYMQIVTTLRLNKIGRRTGRFSGRFGDSLGKVVPLTAKADTEVQKEFVAELAATVTHLKRVDPTSPYHSDLCDVVQQTTDLYDQHTILQDDWRLQMIRTALVKTSQDLSNLTPLHKALIGQQAAYSSISPPSTVSPEASFISSSAALYGRQKRPRHPRRDLALTLVNNLLDQLLFYFLSGAQAMTLSALRPAVAEVLKPKLAKGAINHADAELREYLEEGDEEDYDQRQGTNQSQEWDLELVWRRIRLRCMAYSSLGDMEEEDENLYMEQEKLKIGPDEQMSAVISPAIAVFLTSVLEYMGELILITAGQAAYHRLHIKFQKDVMEGSKSSTEIADRIIVEMQDMERVDLDQTLPRLLRGLRKRIRNPAYDATGRPFSRSSSGHLRRSRVVTELGRSIISYSNDAHEVERDNSTVKEVKSLRQGPGKKKRGFGTQQLVIKKLACLFYKLDTLKYQCCAGYNLTKWDHVLQHLKRLHLIQGEHCPKCREEFEGESAEAEKNEHIRQDTCGKKTALDTGLLLEDEYNGLTGLRGSHEEKWREAWKRLFARHPAPYSPFIELLESVLDAQCNTLERELPSLLQSFLHDASVGRGTVSTADTTNAILRLVRNPISTSNSLAHTERQTELAPPMLGPSPRAHGIRLSRTPEPPLASKVEPFGPSPKAVYAQPIILTMEERNMYESLWHQSFGEFSIYDPDNEELDQWINFSGDGG